jgi:hypothetical protein
MITSCSILVFYKQLAGFHLRCSYNSLYLHFNLTMSYGWSGTHDKRHHGVLLIKDTSGICSMDNRTDTWLHVNSTAQVTCAVSAYNVPYCALSTTKLFTLRQLLPRSTAEIEKYLYYDFPPLILLCFFFPRHHFFLSLVIFPSSFLLPLLLLLFLRTNE